MLKRIMTVGGLTLVSRLTGFLRDIMLAAILGAGPVADAFFIAFRLPYHFRAIFAEGGFNAAFVPAYARVRGEAGGAAAQLFADRIFTMVFATEALLLAVGLLFTPEVISLLAPGFNADPERFAVAVELTHITFPYSLLATLVTLYGGILNALQRFASPAATPILLNLSMMATLALAAFFPTAGHAAAWGVFMAGCLEAAMVAADLNRAKGLPRFRTRRLDGDVRRLPAARQFFKALGPAVLGSAGTQIALFADTIIASFLAAGAVSALYYADRINQLPVGVIGIAVGTVLLPEMANRIVVGDERGASRAQDRAIEFALLLSIPCVAAFAIVPNLIMLALFSRGAFTTADAAAAGATLAAYAIGLLPFVLLRAVSATFLARGDTATPVKALAVAVVINIALKILLMDRYAQVGLAFATSIGVWVNFILLLWFARRRGLISFDDHLQSSVIKLALSGLALAAMLLAVADPVMRQCEALGAVRFVAALGILCALGTAVYGGLVAILFGRSWLRDFRRRRSA
jgi:putative peptidoglycan lipid II flippase